MKEDMRGVQGELVEYAPYFGVAGNARVVEK
jgi:hypothetical protein